jgi:hypothetical protein
MEFSKSTYSLQMFQVGTWGVEFHPELKPETEDALLGQQVGMRTHLLRFHLLNRLIILLVPVALRCWRAHASETAP